MTTTPLPHPLTGECFPSPVPPGSGWPDDPAALDTPVARTPSQVRRASARMDFLPKLDAHVSVCRACPRLVKWREDVAANKRRAYLDQPYWGRPVTSLGPADAWLGVVGLAPAAHGGNRTGRMFTGDRSGDWIHRALHRAGLSSLPAPQNAGDGLELNGIRLIQPIHCAPPQNKPTTEEKLTCRPWLVAELQLLANLEVLMCLGGISWQVTLQAVAAAGWQVPRPRPGFGHGAHAQLTDQRGRPVQLLGCYHPSQHNTFTGKLTESMLDEVVATAVHMRTQP